MDYCIDSNIFIQAKNFHYQFEICPGFWNWIELANGQIGSIIPVYDELQGGNDELKKWSRDIKENGFFIDAYDNQTQHTFAEISEYVMQNYKPHVAEKFLDGADPWLVAYSLTNGCTVVTHEARYNPAVKKKVQIPNICEEFGVKYTDCYSLLKTLGASFVLDK